MKVIARVMLGMALFTLHCSLFTSCVEGTDNVFDDSSAIRLQKSVASYSQLLKDNTQGWSMDFYPGDLTDGGIAYTARFTDSEVTLSCEQAIDYSELVNKSEYKYNAGDEVTSGYTVKSESSVILSFDTFNALIHYWAQPFKLDADGYGGDYEFTFLSACADSVVLRGKKYGNLLRLYPLTVTPAEYVSKAAIMRSKLSTIPRKRIVVDGQTYNIDFANSHLRYFVGDNTYSVPFAFTADGLRFYQPVTIAGVTARELKYDDATNELRAADGRFVLPAPSTTEQFLATRHQWYFGYDKSSGAYDMCDELKSIVADVVKGFKSVGWGYEVMQSFYIGANLQSADKDSHSIVIGWDALDNYGAGDHNYFCYAITMYTADDDTETMSILPFEAGTGFDKKQFCKPFVDFIGQHSPYHLAFDSDDNPTSVVLTSKADSNYWFKLTKK